MAITTLPLDQLLSSSDHAHFSARSKLADVSLAVAKCKRAVVISGAGISCSSGIPDFRSEDGLYSLVKARYPDAFFTGRDLFSSGLFNNPLTTSIFYTFIAELAASCLKAQPTRTHHFISRLAAKGKLLRSYTQNVDGLERRIGLESGGRGTGLKKTTTRNVEMHGDLGRVRCVLCMSDYEAKEEWMDMFKQGEAPWCPACTERSHGRASRSARALPVGSLRPAIVLYDEPHPLGEEIGSLQAYDLGRSPDLLLIMGTSLKVHGLKRVVKAFAKAVHARDGLVVFVNATPPSKEWEGVIDIHVHGTTDAWVDKVESEWKHLRPQDWEMQTRLDAEVVKETSAKTKGKPKAKANKPKQLPTPRPSQSPRRPKDSSTFVLSDDEPLTPLPPTPASTVDDFASPSSSPPISPSKRRAAAPLSPISNAHPSPTKKRLVDSATASRRGAAPKTGVPATPGCGNLFGSRTVSTTSDDWVDVSLNVAPGAPPTPMSPMSIDSDVFGPRSPVEQTVASSPTASSSKGKAAPAPATASTGRRKPTRTSAAAAGKENVRPVRGARAAVAAYSGPARGTRGRQLAGRRTVSANA